MDSYSSHLGTSVSVRVMVVGSSSHSVAISCLHRTSKTLYFNHTFIHHVCHLSMFQFNFRNTNYGSCSRKLFGGNTFFVNFFCLSV